MPKQFLHGADVVTVLKQVSCEGMTQGVATHVLRNTGCPGGFLDTNIINRLVDGTIQPEDLPNDGDFVATHIQIDELNKTKDEERRARLFIKFATTAGDVVPTESLVVGISRVGLSKVSDGKSPNAGYYLWARAGGCERWVAKPE